MPSSNEQSSLPNHLEETVKSVARLHVEHHLDASLYQRAIQRLIARLSEPPAIAVVGGFILVWVAINVVLPHVSRAPFDPPPFAYLEGAMTAAALLMTVLILSSQRHENRLAERRAQLTLELAMVTEQKVAKLIELVQRDRIEARDPEKAPDPETVAMARPADPHAIADAVRVTHDEMLEESEST